MGHGFHGKLLNNQMINPIYYIDGHILSYPHSISMISPLYLHEKNNDRLAQEWLTLSKAKRNAAGISFKGWWQKPRRVEELQAAASALCYGRFMHNFYNLTSFFHSMVELILQKIESISCWLGKDLISPPKWQAEEHSSAQPVGLSSPAWNPNELTHPSQNLVVNLSDIAMTVSWWSTCQFLWLMEF